MSFENDDQNSIHNEIVLTKNTQNLHKIYNYIQFERRLIKQHTLTHTK